MCELTGSPAQQWDEQCERDGLNDCDEDRDGGDGDVHGPLRATPNATTDRNITPPVASEYTVLAHRRSLRCSAA